GGGGGGGGGGVWPADPALARPGHRRDAGAGRAARRPAHRRAPARGRLRRRGTPASRGRPSVTGKADGRAGAPGDPIRVLIADDEALVRAGFRVLVDSAPDLQVIGEASDGVQAGRQTRALRPDVGLMDIRMPVMHGLEATKVMLDSGEDPLPRLLVYTTL